jgi:apolipoprotein N-acyltransferase
VFPGAFALAEMARWYWPFGGVPLANLALSQANAPLGITARLGGPLLVIVLVVVVGQSLSAAYEARQTAPDGPSKRTTMTGRNAVTGGAAATGRTAVIGVAIAAVAVVSGNLHPRSTVVGEFTIAAVQGGGPQRTLASSDQQPVVLARHTEASRQITEPVDLVLWPENVVNPGRYLDEADAFATVTSVADDVDAPVLAGWFLPVSDTANANYQSVITPDGVETDRYDKIRIVPFGEFVPFRSLIETLAPSAPLPRRDVQIGTVEPVLDTDVGPIGVSISWEGFFERRARHSIREGAEVLTNPTNGASYWLTQVQTQQVASNQLRAIENDRWVVQVAPTGLSAIISPDGEVLQRSDVSERITLIDTVERRQGRTLSSLVGPWPVVAYALVSLGYGRLRAPRAKS